LTIMVETRQSRRKNSSADNEDDNIRTIIEKELAELPHTPTRRSTRRSPKKKPFEQEEAVTIEETEEKPKSSPQRSSPRNSRRVSPQTKKATTRSPLKSETKSPPRAKTPTRNNLSTSIETETMGNKSSSLNEARDEATEVTLPPTNSLDKDGSGDEQKPIIDNAGSSGKAAPQQPESHESVDEDTDYTGSVLNVEESDPRHASNNPEKDTKIDSTKFSSPTESSEKSVDTKLGKSKQNEMAQTEVEVQNNASDKNNMPFPRPNDDKEPVHGKGTGNVRVAAGTSKSNAMSKKKSPKNELSSFIPGYTARLQLDSSSLNNQRPGLDALRMRALMTDKTTAAFVKGTLANQKSTGGVLMASKNKASAPVASASTTQQGKVVKSSFKLGTKREDPNHAGGQWFGMTPTPMTEDVKRDLKVIRYRNFLDPKRFYKSADTPSKYVQVGTVIEGTGEFYSSRLTNKERRSNLTEELMADPVAADYAKRKYRAMQQEKGEKTRTRQKLSKSKRGKRYHA
jgi:Fcf2 pre-rRNA processing